MAITALPGLDARIGGLPDGGQYLVYGAESTGKSAFGLSFLHAGLALGETGLLITDQPPRQVVSQSRALGFDLSEAVRDGRLVLFEYPDNIRENLSILIDDSRVARELRALTGERTLGRVVFDPVNPLLASSHPSSPAERVRALAASLAEQGATTLFLLSNDGNTHLASCRGQVSGVLKFEQTAGGARSVRVEGLAGVEPLSVPFELVAGRGFQTGMEPLIDEEYQTEEPMRAVAKSFLRVMPPAFRTGDAVQVERGPRASRILVLTPDRVRRAWLNNVLSEDYRVIEAGNAADALAYTSTENPDVIVVDQDLRGVTGGEVIRRIRSAGRTQPIVAVGGRLARASDTVEAMLAGADACFGLPVDARVLRLTLASLLSWPARPQTWRPASLKAYSSPHRDPVGYTTDCDYFLRRCEYEAEWAAEMCVPFCVVTMRPPANAPVEDLASVAALLTRSSDLTLSGPCGLMILLTEAPSADGFLMRFGYRWTGGYKPVTEVLRFEGQANFLNLLRAHVAGIVETTSASAVRNLVHVVNGVNH